MHRSIPTAPAVEFTAAGWREVGALTREEFGRIHAALERVAELASLSLLPAHAEPERATPVVMTLDAFSVVYRVSDSALTVLSVARARPEAAAPVEPPARPGGNP